MLEWNDVDRYAALVGQQGLISLSDALNRLFRIQKSNSQNLVLDGRASM